MNSFSQVGQTPFFSKEPVLIADFHNFGSSQFPLLGKVKEDISQSTFYILAVFPIGIWYTGIILNQQIRQENISRIISNRSIQKNVS